MPSGTPIGTFTVTATTQQTLNCDDLFPVSSCWPVVWLVGAKDTPVTFSINIFLKSYKTVYCRSHEIESLLCIYVIKELSMSPLCCG